MLRVRDRLPVLVAGPPGAVRYLSAALAPGGGDAVTVVAPDELGSVDLAGYEALFLADALPLSGQAILAIESYVKAGGILAVFAGDGAAPGAYGDLPFLPAPVRGVAQIPVREAVRHIGRVSREDAIFRDFRFPQGVVPTLALKRVLLFDPPAPGGTVVLTAGDDQPFWCGPWSRSRLPVRRLHYCAEHAAAHRLLAPVVTDCPSRARHAAVLAALLRTELPRMSTAGLPRGRPSLRAIRPGDTRARCRQPRARRRAPRRARPLHAPPRRR